MSEAIASLVPGYVRMRTLYREVLSNDVPFFERVLQEMNIRPKITDFDLDRIPQTGPVIVVANHPFGLLEGCVLSAVLPRVRTDFKIMANSLVGRLFPEVGDRFIPVNPFGGAVRESVKGLKASLELLKRGGLLVVFPAGEVSHFRVGQRAVTDPEWKDTIARLVRHTGAAVVPMYFQGSNSALFQIAGMVHPRLRTLMLPREFFNKRGRDVEVRIGSVIPGKRLISIPSDREMTQYLRTRTYLLRHRTECSVQSKVDAASTVDPVSPDAMEREIASLPADRRLDSVGGCTAYYAYAHEAPNVLREIGRLREITFRQAGEGTGKAIDVDAFDEYYIHLFVWNPESREIVGAYRVAETDRVRKQFGDRGLYTSTLFEYDSTFLDRIGPALELGRSFVRAEYQKSFASLLLLWKGIGAYVARNPRYRILFGPVSISNDYHPVSRQLMVTYFRVQEAARELASFVRARTPFRTRSVWGPDGIPRWGLDELSAAVADIETDGKGIPVLLRQYLKLGGSLLAFNVDKQFANALDGLIVVDLAKTDPRMLDRYLGKRGAPDRQAA